MAVIQKSHEDALKEIQYKIKSCRFEIIHKKDQINNINTKISKMDAIIRKHIVSSESNEMQNNSGKITTMIESYQNDIEQKSKRIWALKSQLSKLQAMPRSDKRRQNSILSQSTIKEDGEFSRVDSNQIINMVMETDLEQSNTIDQTTMKGVNQTSSLISASGRRMSTFNNRTSISDRKGSIMREKRASISLKGLQTFNRPSIDIPHQSEKEKPQTLEERLTQVKDKYENIILLETSAHQENIKLEIESLKEAESLYVKNFTKEMNFSTKKLSDSKTFQKYSIELLNSIQGLFPLRINSDKISTYTQCDLDDVN